MPHNFSCCWNCGADEAGNLDPNFVSQTTERVSGTHRSSRLIGFLGFCMWAVTCFLLLLVASFLDRWLPVAWGLRLAGVLSLFLFGLLAGVVMNILAQAYPVLTHYLHPMPQDTSFVQLSEAKPRDPAEHEPPSRL